MSYVAHAVSEMLTVEPSRQVGSEGNVVRSRREIEAGVSSAEGLQDARVVTGQLVSLGEEERLALRLVDADGSVLWAETYSADPARLPTVSRTAARRIAHSMGIAAVELRDLPGAPPEPYELYWRGRYLWSLRDRESIRRATPGAGRIRGTHSRGRPSV